MLVAVSALLCIFRSPSWYVFNDIVLSKGAFFFFCCTAHIAFNQLFIFFCISQRAETPQPIFHGDPRCITILTLLIKRLNTFLILLIFLLVYKRHLLWKPAIKRRSCSVIQCSRDLQASALNCGSRGEVTGYRSSIEGKLKGWSEHRRRTMMRKTRVI